MQLDKFEGTDFKYDNSIFKFKSNYTQSKVFLIPNLKSFIYFFVCDISFIFIKTLLFIKQYLFKNAAQNTQIKHFGSNLRIFAFTKLCPNNRYFAPKLIFFAFTWTFLTFTNSRVLISNIMIVLFEILPKNILMR